MNTPREKENIKKAMDKLKKEMPQRKQHYKVLNYILKKGSLTSLDGAYLFKTSKISTVISELKQDGLPIVSVYVSKNGKNYVRYYWNESLHNELEQIGER